MIVRSAILARQNDTGQNHTLMLYNFQINQNLYIFWRGAIMARQNDTGQNRTFQPFLNTSFDGLFGNVISWQIIWAHFDITHQARFVPHVRISRKYHVVWMLLNNVIQLCTP